MDIIFARFAGQCFGVKRALQETEKAAARAGPVVTLGPLVHNPDVIRHFAERRIPPVDSLDEVNQGTVIIRSHGVGPQVYEEASRKGIELVDATCPDVRRVQHLARELADQGYQVIIIGDPEHPEVQGVKAWTGNRAKVVGSREEAAALSPVPKMAVLAQTTLKEQTWDEIIPFLKEKAEDFIPHKTICRATSQRQQAARELAAGVDAMVVIGGRESSNTRKLAQICAEINPRTYLVENASDITTEMLRGVKRMGVTAGASTPDWIIKEVVNRMSELEKNLENKENQQEEAMTGAEAAREDISAHMAENFKELKEDDLVRGTVVRIDNDEVLVDIGYKSEGVIPLKELTERRNVSPVDIVKVGDEIEAVVIKAEDGEGNVVLSRKRAVAAKAWEHLQKAYENGEIIEAEVIEVVKGGLIADVGVRGFVPASQADRRYVPDLSTFVGKKLGFKIIELDRNKNRVVLSHKEVAEAEHAKKAEETWAKLEPGQIVRGVVRRLTDFGAFVDLGGVDGLIHVSELSWGRVKHPSEVVKEGDEVDVQVLAVDREKGRISLGLKQTKPDPWSLVEQKYPVNTIVTGKVVRLATFGAFVELEPGVDGLVHISQLADHRVAKVEDVVHVGQEVRVKVLDVKPAEKRISLSIREAANADVSPVEAPAAEGQHE